MVLKKYLKIIKIDLIIHLAALAGVRPSIERPLEYEEVNVRGTMNLWELCNQFGIKKIHLRFIIKRLRKQ